MNIQFNNMRQLFGYNSRSKFIKFKLYNGKQLSNLNFQILGRYIIAPVGKNLPNFPQMIDQVKKFKQI